MDPRRARFFQSAITGETDVHIPTTPIVDDAAYERTCQVDAALDKVWFSNHPSKRHRTRIATANELLAFGLPPGSRMLVVQLPYGAHHRVVIEPGAKKSDIRGWFETDRRQRTANF